MISHEFEKLQNVVDRRLGLSQRNTTICDENKKLAERALDYFDAQHFPRLAGEVKQLSAGAGLVADAAVPAVFERTVIREALYKMQAARFVDANVAQFGPSISVPYSYRDTTAAGAPSSRVYEGTEIPRAGVIQAADTAYPIPQKLAFGLSDELRYLASSRRMDWDAVTENLNNCARCISEDTDQLLYNELIRASDEYSAVAVSGEDLELQADGTKRVFVLANFPVVRPRTVRDLQGNAVGATANPISVSYNSVSLEEYDGSGTQSPGTYYVINYNLGEIYLVDESGDIQTPADGTAYAINYAYSSNGYNFDIDEGSAEIAVHWDQFLYRFGLRKAALEDDRHYGPDFALMSGNVATAVEQARTFAANFRRPGTEIEDNGDIGRIKGVATWKPQGLGLYYGDARVLIGQTGTTRLRILKAWTTTTLQSERGPTGRFTGKKSAYGDQFVVVHTPAPLKAAYTSITLYSATARVARLDP